VAPEGGIPNTKGINKSLPQAQPYDIVGVLQDGYTRCILVECVDNLADNNNTVPFVIERLMLISLIYRPIVGPGAFSPCPSPRWGQRMISTEDKELNAATNG
jgi:hypothetical protein